MNGVKLSLGALGLVGSGIVGVTVVSGATALWQPQQTCSDATLAFSKAQRLRTTEPEKAEAAERKMLQVCGAAGAQGEAYSKALPSK
jgi:hypothetical protein